MSRIPTHTLEDAPQASRPVLQRIAQASPSGRPLNLHAQMAHSPAVLAAYASLRGVIGEATAHSGNVTDATWKAAQEAGWGDAELAEAFAHLGLTMFTGYFLNYAQTASDLTSSS